MDWKSTLHGAKEIFWTQDEDAESDTHKEPSAPPRMETHDAAPAGTNPIMGTESLDTIDQKFNAMIDSAWEKQATQPGYPEFMNFFTTLSETLTDQGQCVTAVMALVRKTHSTLDAAQIAASISERRKLLHEYDIDYQKASKDRQELESKNKSQEIEHAKVEIERLTAEIARLTSTRGELESSIAELHRGLAGVTAKWDTFRKRFHALVVARTETLTKLLGFLAPPQ